MRIFVITELLGPDGQKDAMPLTSEAMHSTLESAQRMAVEHFMGDPENCKGAVIWELETTEVQGSFVPNTRPSPNAVPEGEDP